MAGREYAWPRYGVMPSNDQAPATGGKKVFNDVCAQCHSSLLAAKSDLIGVVYKDEKMKAISAEIVVEDGLNGSSRCPRNQSDSSPKTYEKEAAARYAKGGAYPTDLSLITKARNNVFARMLTGYREPSAAVSVKEGLYYNPYFAGGAMAMPKMVPLLKDGVAY